MTNNIFIVILVTTQKHVALMTWYYRLGVIAVDFRNTTALNKQFLTAQ